MRLELKESCSRREIHCQSHGHCVHSNLRGHFNFDRSVFLLSIANLRGVFMGGAVIQFVGAVSGHTSGLPLEVWGQLPLPTPYTPNPQWGIQQDKDSRSKWKRCSGVATYLGAGSVGAELSKSDDSRGKQTQPKSQVNAPTSSNHQPHATGTLKAISGCPVL